MNFVPVYIASAMIVIVITILAYFAYAGYDVRSRGFDNRSNVLMTFYVNGISLKSYYRKRDQHPVVDEKMAEKARMYKIGFYILAAISVAMVAVIAVRIVLNV